MVEGEQWLGEGPIRSGGAGLLRDSPTRRWNCFSRPEGLGLRRVIKNTISLSKLAKALSVSKHATQLCLVPSQNDPASLFAWVTQSKEGSVPPLLLQC